MKKVELMDLPQWTKVRVHKTGAELSFHATLAMCYEGDTFLVHPSNYPWLLEVNANEIVEVIE